jgi:branched-chain amino acid transport system substrate-binding protein
VTVAAGCGSGEGVAEGATVTVYASVPLHGSRAAQGRTICSEAQREAGRDSGRVAGLRLHVVCLDDTGGANRWTLASVGANARRALEDSSTIAYIGEPETAAARFSAPILESAGIPQLTNKRGTQAVTEIRRAVDAAGGSGNLREAVLHELQ